MTLDRSCVSPNLRVVVGAPRADGVVICDEWHAQRLGLGSLGDSVALIDAVDRYEPQADVPVGVHRAGVPATGILRIAEASYNMHHRA